MIAHNQSSIRNMTVPNESIQQTTRRSGNTTNRNSTPLRQKQQSGSEKTCTHFRPWVLFWWSLFDLRSEWKCYRQVRKALSASKRLVRVITAVHILFRIIKVPEVNRSTRSVDGDHIQHKLHMTQGRGVKSVSPSPVSNCQCVKNPQNIKGGVKMNIKKWPLPQLQLLQPFDSAIQFYKTPLKHCA